MLKKLIYITDNDMKRLKELIMVAKEFGNKAKKYLRELEDELAKGVVINSRNIPNNIITMNSKIRLRDINTQKEMICWLVFPGDSNADQGKISILAPIGTALLGYTVGDIIEWRVPAGLTKLKVEEILYQPEAAGDYQL
ncbi:MAG: nucleoside diphosphate kinase regulator [Atribacterota bacterium]|nr:nucleoside diphosphate kinase regulator [Atribacterota bacterium]